MLAAGSYFTWNGRNIPEKVQTGDVTYDVLIIGSGGAGMRAALAAAENKDLKVAVMTKLIPTRSASTMAQGRYERRARLYGSERQRGIPCL